MAGPAGPGMASKRKSKGSKGGKGTKGKGTSSKGKGNKEPSAVGVERTCIKYVGGAAAALPTARQGGAGCRSRGVGGLDATWHDQAVARPLARGGSTHAC